MELDKLLCYCFHIKKRKIVNFVRQTRPRRASQVSECFGAGTGCGWCIPFLKRIHAQIMRGDAIEAGDIGSEEYEALRREYLQGIKDGTCERNTHGVAAAPVIGGAEKSLMEDSPAEEWPGSAATGKGDEDDEDQDWDVSDYFSRPRPPDPEPETLS